MRMLSDTSPGAPIAKQYRNAFKVDHTGARYEESIDSNRFPVREV